MEFNQLKNNELKEFREALTLKQNNICPILNAEMEPGTQVLDHQHKTKKEVMGVNGAGLIRGVLDFRANAWEGKVNNSFIRCGLHKVMDLPTALRNLADYLEQENLPYIHPNEAPKVKKLMKRPFNKIKKLHDLKYPKRKGLMYPKSGKPTKIIIELSKEFSIEI